MLYASAELLVVEQSCRSDESAMAACNLDPSSCLIEHLSMQV